MDRTGCSMKFRCAAKVGLGVLLTFMFLWEGGDLVYVFMFYVFLGGGDLVYVFMFLGRGVALKTITET